MGKGMILGDWIKKAYEAGRSIDYAVYQENESFPQQGITADRYWTHVLETLRGFYMGDLSTFPEKQVKGISFTERHGVNGPTFDPVEVEEPSDA